MTPQDKAIAILAATQDGQRLARLDLKLVELAGNDNLSDKGLAALDTLHQQVLAGTYEPEHHYLFGIEHLTRDSEGYVYWKNRQVEHYSHQDPDDMKRDAQALAERCLALEAKGFPVSGRSVTEPIFEQAPPDTPWLEAMNRFYSLFEGNGRHVAVLYRYASPEVVVVERDKATGELKQTQLASAYDAFHFVQDQGLKSGSPYNQFEAFTRFFEASGLTPQDVHAVLG